MTESGVYAGNVDVVRSDEETVTVDCQLVPMPELSAGAFFADVPSTPTFPLGLILTEFHALLAYSNRVRGVCLLNEQVNIYSLFDVGNIVKTEENNRILNVNAELIIFMNSDRSRLFSTTFWTPQVDPSEASHRIIQLDW